MKEKLYRNIDLRLEAVEETIKYQFEALGVLLGEVQHIQYLNFLTRQIEKKPIPLQADKHTVQQ